MNAKEKAKELFTTFRYALSHKDAPLGMHKDNIAIQCALIAVEEIINSRPTITDSQVEYNNYWNDVKSKLQSL